jgi:hypothetical protein
LTRSQHISFVSHVYLQHKPAVMTLKLEDEPLESDEKAKEDLRNRLVLAKHFKLQLFTLNSLLSPQRKMKQAQLRGQQKRMSPSHVWCLSHFV